MKLCILMVLLSAFLQMFLRTVVDSVEDLWRKGLPLGAQKPAGLVLARVEEASCQGDGLDGSNELLEGVSEAWAKLTSLPPGAHFARGSGRLVTGSSYRLLLTVGTARSSWMFPLAVGTARARLGFI